MSDAAAAGAVRKLRCIQRSVDRHRVGNGFPVRTLFAYPNPVGLFDRAGTTLCIDGGKGATALLLAGEPIDEPIVGSGPFVMNTAQEIRQAIADYQAGRMGRLS